MTLGGTMYNKGDVVLLPFPFSDLRGSKKRPALIISNKKFNNSEDRICCLITSNPKTKGLLIKDQDYKSGRLPFTSWIKPDRLFTVNENIILRKLCTVKTNVSKNVLSGIIDFLK